MVKGLENDEIEFLEKVSRQKEQEEEDKDMEERLLLAEYKVEYILHILRVYLYRKGYSLLNISCLLWKLSYF